MRNKLFKKTPKLFYTIASLGALAAINYTLIPTPFVFLALGVLLVHELAHYFTAKRLGAEVSLPIFIPLPFIAIAFTKAKGLSSRSKMKVALSGPVTGFIAAVLFIIFNFIFQIVPSLSLVILAIGEILFNFIGTDGKKYRSAKKDIKLCIS